MYDVLLFGGTTEGRILAEAFQKTQTIRVCFFTATKYGGTLVEESDYLHVHTGRLDFAQICQWIQKNKNCHVVDATHPFATEVSRNVKEACTKERVPYLRVLREESKSPDSSVFYAGSTDEAVSYLEETKGNIFVTTGSKELHKFCRLKNFKRRVYARVLSLPSVMTECAGLGIEGRHLIGMQGPFSEELNYAMLLQTKAKWLVTKESGKTGGFDEKIQAADKAGVRVVVIGRPVQDPEGMPAEAVLGKICEAFHTTPPALPENRKKRKIGVIGSGTSSMSEEAGRFLNEADLILSSKRILEMLPEHPADRQTAYLPEDIVSALENHPTWKQAAVLFSGDIGFYSGAKKLYPRLEEVFSDCEIDTFPGISSAADFCAKLHESWEDADFISIHGREDRLLQHIRTHRKTICTLGTEEDMAKLSKKLIAFGFLDVQIFLGECLGTKDERITYGSPFTFFNIRHDKLAIVLIKNPFAEQSLHPYLPDQEFTRGKVPMTKEELRTVIVAKMRLKKTDTVFDIGAGTGSVSMEMARIVPDGTVYAIECKDEAVSLISDNAQRFGLDHVIVINGTAPAALETLPSPDAAFIGGSKGALDEIVELLIQKNPEIRIVISAITLETMQQASKLMQTYPKAAREVVQIAVSRGKKAGAYHLMMAENPVCLYVFDFGNCCEEGL